jgi:hypothetical protein
MAGKSATNYSAKPATDLTPVPVQTDFFDTWPKDWKGALTSQWILFFSQLQKQGTGEVFPRTLLLKNTATGNDIADWVIAQKPGTAFQVTGVLRKAITANLVVRINVNRAPFIVCTINQTTQPGTPLTWTSFATNGVLAAGDVFSWDVLASDGSSDAAGIASFTVLWQ